MQFTLGMPFLGVLGKFYRNIKGLIKRQKVELAGKSDFVAIEHEVMCINTFI